MLTQLEIFEKVSTHLLKQKQKSLSQLSGEEALNPSCAYRGDNGLMCAAGVLILDEFYHPYLENKTADSDRVAPALVKSGVNMNDVEISTMVVQLQRIHDDYEPEFWAEKLKEFR